MYNRYTRNDTGVYTRVPQTDSPPVAAEKPQANSAQAGAYPPRQAAENTPQPSKQGPSAAQRPERDILNRFLSAIHLGDLDAGDLLVLALLFMLFRENADEELLIALGLLLIL